MIELFKLMTILKILLFNFFFTKVPVTHATLMREIGKVHQCLEKVEKGLQQLRRESCPAVEVAEQDYLCDDDNERVPNLALKTMEEVKKFEEY